MSDLEETEKKLFNTIIFYERKILKTVDNICNLKINCSYTDNNGCRILLCRQDTETYISYFEGELVSLYKSLVDAKVNYFDFKLKNSLNEIRSL